jgi:CRP-like cAMP-binding protein
LQSLAIFAEWDEAMLNQLYYHFSFKSVKMNEIIYKEGDKAQEIYLLKEGEVEISKIIEV